MLNEASAGFWTDAQLFNLMTSSQREIIDVCLMKQREAQKLDPFYEHPSLRPVTKLNQITTTSATSYALTGITDMLHTLRVELLNSSPARTLGTTLVSYTKFLQQKTNTYRGHGYSGTTFTGDVYTAIAVSTLYTSFTTFPNTDFDKINVYYVSNPAAMTTDVDPVLYADLHDSIIYISYAKALMKDGRENEGQIAYQKGIGLIA
jgi:hypothetical protein